MRSSRLWALVVGSYVSLVAPVMADNYPSRPIRLILGPTPEATPRLIAERLQKELGQPVVVEPRLGAGGEVAAKAVAGAEADGYTLLYASSNFTLATAMQLGSFNFATDFEPVGRVSTTPYVLVASPDVPVKTPQELIALAKAKPGQLNCGSSGMATPGHLSCEMLKTMAGIEIVHVPFRSVGMVLNAVAANQVQFAITPSSGTVGLLDGGAVRGLAVTTAEASPLVRGLNPLQAVIPDFVVHGWGAIVAPKGTAREVVTKVNAALMRVLQDPEVRARLVSFGSQPENPHTSEQFGQVIRSEIARWNRTIDIARIQRGKPM